MVNEPLSRNGDGLEAPVGMLGKAWHHIAVVHAPTVDALKVIADIAAFQGGHWPHGLVAGRVGVVVVDTEKERISRFPGESQGFNVLHGAEACLGSLVGLHGNPSFLSLDCIYMYVPKSKEASSHLVVTCFLDFKIVEIGLTPSNFILGKICTSASK